MKSWLLFWAVLIGIGLTASWIGETFGEAPTQWFSWLSLGALTIGVLVARSAHKARIEQVVDGLVDEHRNGNEGVLSKWYDEYSNKEADRYRVAEAAGVTLRVYGGRHVINELVNEGHQHVLYADLEDVFGDYRAELIMFEIVGMANRPGFMAHLGAFGLGALVGYKATVRR